MSKIMIIINPSSGREEATTYASHLLQVLMKQSHEIDVRISEDEGDIKRFAHCACKERVHQVYLLGGDGTVHKAINGMANNEYRPAVGILPSGTVNNLARMLGISMNMNEAIADFTETDIQPVDIGEINGQYFISTVSAGSIPESVQDVDSDSKTQFGPLAYLMSGMKALNEQNAIEFEFEVDGKRFSYTSDMIVIGVGNSVSGISNFFSNATLDDGLLHMLVLRNTTALEKLQLVPHIFGVKKNMDIIDDPDFKYIQFHDANIKIVEGSNHYTTVDGESGPAFPLSIKVIPRHMNFLIPRRQGD